MELAVLPTIHFYNIFRPVRKVSSAAHHVPVPMESLPLVISLDILIVHLAYPLHCMYVQFSPQ